jgi:integrase
MKRGRKATTDFVVYARRILERKKLKAPKTYIGAELHIRKLCEFFADKTLEDITEDAWTDYCVWRRSHNPSCRLFDDRKQLTTILFSAEREGLISRRPRLAVMDRKRQVGREITEAELGRIYERASADLTFQIDIALHMGLRLNEMLSLRWDQIDWEARVIRVWSTKTDRGRTVPIHSRVVDRLRAIGTGEKGKPVLSLGVWRNRCAARSSQRPLRFPRDASHPDRASTCHPARPAPKNECDPLAALPAASSRESALA